MDKSVVDMLEQEWVTIYELVSSLDEKEWMLPTDCPGWTIKDQISHIVGTERMLLGEKAPEGVLSDTANVRNPIGNINELWVDVGRRMSIKDILCKFHEVTSKRIDYLRSMSDEDFSKESWTPIGQAPYSEFMAIRVFDCWVHEQDIRRAVKKHGNLSSLVAAHCQERIKKALPYVVAKKANSPNGSLITFLITEPIYDRIPIEVQDGRGKVVILPQEVVTSQEDSKSIVELEMDFETLVCLSCGRWTVDQAGSRVRIKSSSEAGSVLGQKIVENLNFMI
ncbi:MAG: maleylpyruvate isomerase N-terminal domain-containing protein [Actinobacteria bacterium]|nr:maleylpyruvate isomerase N-terminal domain-containing protein [Actinomycetota bacterium]